jgi:hypothetical protein
MKKRTEISGQRSAGGSRKASTTPFDYAQGREAQRSEEGTEDGA